MPERFRFTLDRNPDIPRGRIATLYDLLRNQDPLTLAIQSKRHDPELHGTLVGYPEKRWIAYDTRYRSDIVVEVLQNTASADTGGPPSLELIRPFRGCDTIHIPLPPALWRPTAPSPGDKCHCAYCRGAGSFWDTLSLAAEKVPDNQADCTWMSHQPGYQPKLDRLRITVDCDTALSADEFGELYQSFARSDGVHIARRPSLKAIPRQGTGEGPDDMLWISDDGSPQGQVTVEILKRSERPATASPPHLGGLQVRRVGGNIYIPLPKALWVPMKPPFAICNCPYCAGTTAFLDTLTVTAEEPIQPELNSTWLLHAPRDRFER